MCMYQQEPCRLTVIKTLKNLNWFHSWSGDWCLSPAEVMVCVCVCVCVSDDLSVLNVGVSAVCHFLMVSLEEISEDTNQLQ